MSIFILVCVCGVTLKILMNVRAPLTLVVQMPPVLTPSEASIAPVCLGMMEMDSTALVCGLCVYMFVCAFVRSFALLFVCFAFVL